MVKKIGIYQDRRKRLPWIVRWFGVTDITTGKRKRYSKSFMTLQEAQKFQAEQTLAFMGGRPRDVSEEVTLKQFLTDWLRTKHHSVRPNTYRDYKRYADRLKVYFGPDCLIRQIGTYAANQFYAELQSETSNPLSDWSKNTILRYCRSIFQDAVAWELIQSNPFRKVKAKKTSVRHWHYLNIDQYEKLLAAAPGLRWQALYSLAYTTGLRFGELFNLRWADIDFDNNKVNVRNHEATEQLPPFTTKNGKERTVPLTKHTKEILLKWKLQQGRNFVPYALLTKVQYENVIARWKQFRKTKRTWENKDMINNLMREFKRHIKKAKIKPSGTLTIHTLRKCAGKNWADSINNPRIVQELMGHGSLSTTMAFYNQVNNEDLAKAANGIDDLLSRTDAKLTPDAALA